MPHLILFEDNPDAPADLRARHMGSHLAFLEAEAAVIEAAGPLFTATDAPAGGAWIVDANSDEAEALVRADPFWTTGLRKSHRVLEWRQVFAEGRRLISP